jgi:rubrerythrin
MRFAVIKVKEETMAVKKAVKKSVKKVAKKAVKEGDVYKCSVCGLAVTVDEVCGCVDACDIVCCEKPMKPKRRAS